MIDSSHWPTAALLMSIPPPPLHPLRQSGFGCLFCCLRPIAGGGTPDRAFCVGSALALPRNNNNN